MAMKLPVAGVAALCAAGLWSSTAMAAGFAVIEHSAKGMGNAFAGGGAVAEDASTVWFNPASMIQLGPQLQASVHYIAPAFEFSDDGSVQSLGAATVPLLPGAASSVDGGTDALVPNLYYVRPLGDRWRFGLAVNVPFGLAIEYDAAWKGRYQAIDSEIVTVHVNPALALRVTDAVTVGAGVNAAYIDAKLTNAIDFAAICAARVGAGCIGLPGQGANDGFVRNDADDVSFGWNVGLLLEPSERTRVSLAYRSEIRHKLDGRARFSVPASVNAAPGADAALRSLFADDGIEAGVTLPDQLSISAYHRIHPKLGLMADATWTGWSDIPQLLIVFDNPATAGGPSRERLDWVDTWRLSLGLSYYHDERLTLRTGVAFDESPVTSPSLRPARLPDNDRIWLAFGVSYRATDALSADFGYSHLFFDDTSINRVGSTGNVLIGTYESDVDIFSAQINYRFD